MRAKSVTGIIFVKNGKLNANMLGGVPLLAFESVDYDGNEGDYYG